MNKILETLQNSGKLTHMPFLFRDLSGQKILLYTAAKPCDSEKCWKLYFLTESGEHRRIETGFEHGVIECSPTAWQDESGFHVSFVAGKSSGPLRLYRMDGTTPDTLSKPVSMRIARTGFVHKDRLAVGEIQDVVHVHDTTGDYRIEIPGAFLYRVSYRSDAPERILISGDWIGEKSDVFCLEYDLLSGEQRFIECDGLPAYKCCILDDEILFAEKTGSQFEDRHIRHGTEIIGVPCAIASKSSDSISESAIAISKRCGCRLSQREKALREGTIARPSCLECVEKHLGAAFVIASEIQAGYSYRLRLIGHLHEAEDESQEFSALHQAIRDARKSYQKTGKIPDWEFLANAATEAKNAH